MAFRLGQKVVCISESYRPESAVRHGEVKNLPRLNRVYTVRAIKRTGHIYLREVRNPLQMWEEGRSEYAFHPARFRPVVDKQTDISVFTALLSKHDRKSKVPA